MQLSNTLEFRHTLLDYMQAGGPGSGCRGSNCGRPRGVKQVYQTHSGVSYTILKPSRRGMGGRGPANYQKRKDQFKGKYNPVKFRWAQGVKKVADVPHIMNPKTQVSNVFDAKYGKGDRYEGHGKTVFVHRDFKAMRIVVQEVPHDEMGHSAVMRSFKFKNFGQAAGFLSKRYGIRMKLPRGVSSHD